MDWFKDVVAADGLVEILKALGLPGIGLLMLSALLAFFIYNKFKDKNVFKVKTGKNSNVSMGSMRQVNIYQKDDKKRKK